MERFGSFGRFHGFGRFGSGTIGMDIDRAAIKAVQVSGGGSVLQHVGYHRLPPGAVSEGEVLDHDLLADEIREFWSTHAFRGRSVILGVCNPKIVVRLLDFPRMDPEDLSGAIGFEAQDHIPMPLDDAVLDYLVIGPREEGSDHDRVLVVAAQREMIGHYTSALRAGGLRPAGVDVKALSLTRSILPDPFFGEEGAVLLIDVGAEITNLVIVDGGRPLLTRFLPVGVVDLVASVAAAADLPADEAEKLALGGQVGLGQENDGAEEEAWSQEGEADFDPALVYDVRRGLESATQTLAEDVQGSLDHHHAQAGTREVSRAIVSGEGALVPGFDDYLGELLGITIGRGNPIGRLSANRSNVSDEQLRAMEPVLAVAFGLALEDA